MFQIESTPDATVVRVRCEIDFAVKAEFLAVLLLACRGASARLVVSLEECPYMDCAGLSVLVRVRNTTQMSMSVLVREDSYLSKLFALADLEGRLGVSDGRIAIAAM